MILITGGTGALARLTIQRLAGRDAVVGSRTPQAVTGGLPTRHLDFDDPATLAPALAGVDTLVLVSAGFAEDDVVLARHGAVSAAAARAGVRHVVYTSLYGAGDGLGIAVAHRWTERALADAPFAVTVLRNGLYPEVPAALAAGAAPSPSTDVLTAPWGSGRISLASREDLAEALATVATQIDEALTAGRPTPHAGRTYELAHPEPVSGETVAAALSRPDAPVRYVATPLADARAALVASGAPAYQAAHGLSILSNAVAGALVQPHTDLPELLAGPPRDVLPEVVSALGHPALAAAG
jgi:NAD(P)H dehydrogenase (quinone)